MKKAFVLAAAFTALCLGSCKKSDDAAASDSSKYVGSFMMSSGCWAVPRAVPVSANGSSSILLPYVLGEGTSCQKGGTVAASVSGNTILSSTNTVFDACNNAYNQTVSGSINGNTLTLYYTWTNAYGTASCTFVGSK